MEYWNFDVYNNIKINENFENYFTKLLFHLHLVDTNWNYDYILREPKFFQ